LALLGVGYAIGARLVSNYCFLTSSSFLWGSPLSLSPLKSSSFFSARKNLPFFRRWSLPRRSPPPLRAFPLCLSFLVRPPKYACPPVLFFPVFSDCTFFVRCPPLPFSSGNVSLLIFPPCCPDGGEIFRIPPCHAHPFSSSFVLHPTSSIAIPWPCWVALVSPLPPPPVLAWFFFCDHSHFCTLYSFPGIRCRAGTAVRSGELFDWVTAVPFLGFLNCKSLTFVVCLHLVLGFTSYLLSHAFSPFFHRFTEGSHPPCSLRVGILTDRWVGSVNF